MFRSKAFDAAVLGGVALVMLIFAPSSALADSDPIVCPGDARCATVSWDPSPGVGLVVHVVNNNSGRWQCNYTATPAANPLNLPPYQHQFALGPPDAGPEASWTVTTFGGLPAVASGTQWNVLVDCTRAEPASSTLTMKINTTKVF